MKSQKQDSVQGFLTSTKLLSSKMKPNKNSKVNKSVIQSLLSNNQSQEESFAGTSRERKQRQTQKKNLIESLQKSSRKKENSENSGEFDNSYLFKKKSSEKNNSHNQSNFLLDDQEDRQSKRSSQKSKSRRSSKYKPIGPYGTSEEEKSPSKGNEISLFGRESPNNQSRNFSMPVKKNPQISQLQAKQLINRIAQLKSSLELEISQLQHILDNTSNYLENIDEEFEKIKERILSYTSISLDAAFKRYKNNFPDWSRYESVEHNALTKLNELNQTVEGFRQGRQQDEFASTYELQKKLENYNLMIKDVEEARKECLELRPKITQDRLKRYEEAVGEIGKF